MVELTGALRAELMRMREESGRSAAPIRVTRQQDGAFALEFDEKKEGDVSVVDDHGSLTVIVSRDLAEQLDGAILHFRGAGDDRYGDAGLVLLGTRPGTPRREWTPPIAAPRTPLWTRLRRQSHSTYPSSSATQTASP